MKIYLKALGYIFGGMLVLTLLITFLHFFNIIGIKMADISKILISIVCMIVGGYIVGKEAEKKGWLEGIKLAAVVIPILFLITLTFRLGLSYKIIIFYLILIAAAVFGSMFGISRKKKTKG